MEKIRGLVKYRSLKNGQRVAEAKKSVKMTLDTKCPRKWLLVDMETGDLWVHWSRFPDKEKPRYQYYSADPKAIDAISKILLARFIEKVNK